MRLRFALSAALAAAILPSAAGACSGTLSGPVQGAFACTATVTAAADGRHALVIEPVGGVAGVKALVVRVDFAGTPRAGSFSLVGLPGARSSLETAAGAAYSAEDRPGATRGELTLEIDTVERETRGGITVGGRLRARLVPAGDAKGEPVVVEVSF